MPKAKPTSVDVARRAGVSQSAVSRCFRPGGSVSPATAERIRAAAEELGYRPNALAQSLITGRSRLIGLVVFSFEDPFYPDAVQRLSVALHRVGYHVLFLMAAPTVGEVGPVLQELLDRQVEGVVMVSVSLSSVLAERCRAEGIPVVLFNRDQADPRLSAVTADNALGGRLAGEALVADGHRRIAHLAGFGGASTQIEREAGFLAALAEAGLAPHAREGGDSRAEPARAAALRLMGRPEPPDAIFAGSDHMALAALDAIRFEMGLSVPGDVAVIGFDDVAAAAARAYDLSTIRQPVAAMVERAVALLTGAIEAAAAGGGEVAPRKIRLEPTLIRRGTTRPPRGD